MIGVSWVKQYQFSLERISLNFNVFNDMATLFRPTCKLHCKLVSALVKALNYQKGAVIFKDGYRGGMGGCIPPHQTFERKKSD